MPLTGAVLSEELIRSAAAAAPITASSRTDDIPDRWDERAVLTTMLDYVRDTVHVKCAGLSEEQARRAPLPGSPLTNISSLVSHLRWVEYYWIRVVLLGEEDRAPITEQDPDAEMRLGLDVPIARLLAEYRTSCDQLRDLVAPLDLDTPSQGTLSWRREPVTLRWVLMHLIEETARHNGHIDILREMADGVTGR
ncbi:MAG TPA: DinB family protein [Streptosporangiaceae bacterium]|nr:DinB family protein [Streptosporangiaceae bacterium]